MKIEVDLPDDIAQHLSQEASATGGEVVHLVEMLIVQHVRSGAHILAGSRRRPDLPLEPVEISAPFDLPRAGDPQRIPVAVDGHSQRRPDPFSA